MEKDKTFQVVADAFVAWKSACHHNANITDHSKWVDTLRLFEVYSRKIGAFAEIHDLSYNEAQRLVWDETDKLFPPDQPYKTTFTGAIE